MKTDAERQAELMGQTFEGKGPEDVEDPKNTPPGEEGAEGTEGGAEGAEGSEEEVEEEDVDLSELNSLLGTEEEEETADGGEGEGEEGADDDTSDSFDLSDDEFDEVVSSKDGLKKYAERIRKDALAQAQKTIKQAVDEAKQEVLRSIPEIVDKSTKRTQSVNTLITDMFKENPALESRKGYVRDMTKFVATQNPDWTAKQVLDEVVIRAKRDIGALDEAESREKHRPKPKFAGAGGRRAPSGSKDTRTTQEKLLDQTFGIAK